MTPRDRLFMCTQQFKISWKYSKNVRISMSPMLMDTDIYSYYFCNINISNIAEMSYCISFPCLSSKQIHPQVKPKSTKAMPITQICVKVPSLGCKCKKNIMQVLPEKALQ